MTKGPSAAMAAGQTKATSNNAIMALFMIFSSLLVDPQKLAGFHGVFNL
jgi:hypothetical protein